MSNVNPNHYKVAGRERQGDGLLQDRHRQRFADNQARERFESRQGPPAAPAGVLQDPAMTAGEMATEATPPTAAARAPGASRRRLTKPVGKASKKVAKKAVKKAAKKAVKKTASRAARKTGSTAPKRSAKTVAKAAAKRRPATAGAAGKRSKASATASRGRQKRAS